MCRHPEAEMRGRADAGQSTADTESADERRRTSGHHANSQHPSPPYGGGNSFLVEARRIDVGCVSRATAFRQPFVQKHAATVPGMGRAGRAECRLWREFP